jgi:hypothetical protein
MNHAGAALAGITTDVRASEPEMIPEELHQQHARLDVCRDYLSVHAHRNSGHPLPPFNLVLVRRKRRSAIGFAGRSPIRNEFAPEERLPTLIVYAIAITRQCFVLA